MHWPQHQNLCQLWGDPAKAHLRKGKKLASGSCIHENDTLHQKPISAPIRVCSGKQRFLVSPLPKCSPYEQGVSGLPPAPCALVLCWWSLEMETNSKRALLWGEGGWGLKRPCVHWPHHPTFHQLGRDPPRAHLRKGTEPASGSCIFKIETLLGKPSSAPKLVSSGKHLFLVSPLGLCFTMAKEGLGCLLLPGQWCCAAVRWSWKPTPNVLSFGENADGA